MFSSIMRIYFTLIWFLYHTDAEFLDSLRRSVIVKNHWFWVSSDDNLRGKCKYYLADHMIDILSGVVSAWWLASLWLRLRLASPVPGPLTPDDGDQGWGLWRGQAGSPVRGVSPGHTEGPQEGGEVSTRQRWNMNMRRLGVWRLSRTLLPFGYISMLLNWFDQTFNLGHTFVVKVDRG